MSKGKREVPADGYEIGYGRPPSTQPIPGRTVGQPRRAPEGGAQSHDRREAHPQSAGQSERGRTLTQDLDPGGRPLARELPTG
jgi:hypothetical protein